MLIKEPVDLSFSSSAFTNAADAGARRIKEERGLRESLEMKRHNVRLTDTTAQGHRVHPVLSQRPMRLHLMRFLSNVGCLSSGK